MADKKSTKRMIDVLDYILFRILLVSSPLMPFMAEGIYLERYKRNESIFLESWPKSNRTW